MLKYLFIASLCALTITAAHAERQGYAYLGMQLEHYDYSERLDRLAIKTEYDALNMGIQTGSYVAINPKLGFYITGDSTLISNAEQEQWRSAGDLWQTDDVTLSVTQNRIDAVFPADDRRAVLFGLHTTSAEFDRFNFTVTPAGVAAGVVNPNGNTANVADAVSEKQLSVSVAVGYEVGNVFNDTHKGKYVYLAQAMVGLPIYHRVTNTSIGRANAITDNFGGYSVISRFLGGIKLSENMIAAATLDFSYHHHDALSGSGGTVPGVTFYQIKPGLALYWSF